MQPKLCGKCKHLIGKSGRNTIPSTKHRFRRGPGSWTYTLRCRVEGCDCDKPDEVG